MVATVQPNAAYKQSTNIVLLGGATSAWQGEGDASDTTGVTASADNAWVQTELATPTALASNQRVRAWRGRYHVARTAADGHTQEARFRLRDTDGSASAYDAIRYGSPTPVKEFVGPWRSFGVASKPFSNTLLARLRLETVWPARILGAPQWLEVRGVFIDFDYNTQPTVATVAFSSLTTTSFPDVTWDYDDTENDPQVAYRLKVFLTSVATAGGFDPETSGQAVYDSGIQSGSQQFATVGGKGLLNGQAYTAYVKVAQAWAGPEGTLWWSNWGNSASGTIVFSPPAAPTAALTAITTLPDYRLLHTITAGSAGGGTTSDIQLQVLEKTFRDRGNFYNWAHPQIVSCGALTYGVDGFYTRLAATLTSYPLDTAHPAGPLADVGSRMISWNPSVGAFSGLDVGLDNNASTDEQPPYIWPAVPGLAMRLSVWARTRSGTFVTKLHHISVNAANGSLQDAVGSQVTLTTSWQRLEVTFTPPAGAIYGRGSVENVTPTTGVETLWTGWQVGPDPGAGAILQGGIGKYLSTAPATSWTDVRTREVLTGYASGAKAYIVDNELSGRPVIYRARQVTTITGQSVSGPWAYYSSYVASPTTTIIRDPYQPDNVLLAKRDGRSSEANTADMATFHAAGRDGDPITLTDWVGGRDGSMIIAWESVLEERLIRELVRSPRPLLVQWHDGGASYVQFVSWEWTHFDASGGRFTGDYIEKGRP
jgi:hypothetical protein